MQNSRQNLCWIGRCGTNVAVGLGRVIEFITSFNVCQNFKMSSICRAVLQKRKYSIFLYQHESDQVNPGYICPLQRIHCPFIHFSVPPSKHYQGSVRSSTEIIMATQLIPYAQRKFLKLLMDN